MILYTDNEISDAMLCIGYLKKHAEDDGEYSKNEKCWALDMAFDALSRLPVGSEDDF